MTQGLIVKVIAGTDDLERCIQGLTVATTAAVSGVPVSVWLAGEAAWLAVPDRAAAATLPNSPPAAELLESIAELGSITLCARCADRRDLTPDAISPAINIAGAATFVAEVTQPNTQALVY